MEQLLAHLVGDYVLQNGWLGTTKKNRNFMGGVACLIHCLIYTSVFLFITTNPIHLALIFITHFVIDRYHWIEWFIMIKEKEMDITNHGFPKDTPHYFALWRFIIDDNTFHLVLNYLIIKFI